MDSRLFSALLCFVIACSGPANKGSMQEPAVPIASENWREIQELFFTFRYGTPQEVRDGIAQYPDGVAVAIRFRRKVTPLMSAARDNNNAEVISILLEAGADVSATDLFGENALMSAAGYNQNSEVISLLLEAGADIHARDDDGKTVLMHAAHYNPNPEIILLLLEAGAEINAKQDSDTTALTWAVMWNPNTEIISLLIEAGAQVDSPKGGMSPLLFADGNVEIITMLLEAGADIHAKGEFAGWTPLMNAAMSDSPEGVSLLLEAGAELEDSDHCNMTPLLLASAYTTNPEVISVLLKAGADVRAKCEEGKTVLDYALQNHDILNSSTYEELVAAVRSLNEE